MNKTYIALELKNKELNINTIYFTDNYLSKGVINPKTQNPYSKEEIDSLEIAAITAPKEGRYDCDFFL